jgi:hypothetical protein
MKSPLILLLLFIFSISTAAEGGTYSWGKTAGSKSSVGGIGKTKQVANNEESDFIKNAEKSHKGQNCSEAEVVENRDGTKSYKSSFKGTFSSTDGFGVSCD